MKIGLLPLAGASTFLGSAAVAGKMIGFTPPSLSVLSSASINITVLVFIFICLE